MVVIVCASCVFVSLRASEMFHVYVYANIDCLRHIIVVFSVCFACLCGFLSCRVVLCYLFIAVNRHCVIMALYVCGCMCVVSLCVGC